jgi:hypothetical protein
MNARPSLVVVSVCSLPPRQGAVSGPKPRRDYDRAVARAIRLHTAATAGALVITTEATTTGSALVGSLAAIATAQEGAPLPERHSL